MDWSTILAPVVPVFAGFIIYLARVWVLAKVGPERIDAIGAIAMAAVSAAEECGRTAPIGGADKFTLASDALTAYAKRIGIRLSPDEVQTFIHSALVASRQFEQQAR